MAFPISIERRRSATPGSTFADADPGHPERVERLALGMPIARRGGRLERRLTVGDRVAVAPAQESRTGQPRHQRRPLDADLVGGQQRQRPLSGRDRLEPAVQRPLDPRLARQQAGVAALVEVRIDLLERGVQQRLGASPVRRDAVRARGELEQIDACERDRAACLGNPWPEHERALGEIGGLSVRVHVPRRERRRHGRAQRRGLVPGGGVMPGDRCGQLGLLLVVVHAPRLERMRQRLVQLAALAREEVVVQRLAQQRVAEHQPVVLRRDQHLLGDRLAQRRLQRLGIDAGDRADRRLVEPAAGGDRARGPLGLGGQALDPQQERVAEALRRGAAAVHPRGQQLLGVQGISLAAGEQAVDERVVRRRAKDVGEHLGQLVAVERREFDPPHALEPLELGQQRAQRVAAMELVGAVRERRQHALAAQAARQEGRERPRRAVGPMHVLEDQQHRPLLADHI